MKIINKKSKHKANRINIDKIILFLTVQIKESEIKETRLNKWPIKFIFKAKIKKLSKERWINRCIKNYLICYNCEVIKKLKN